ncbi:hypothetical protein FUA23_12480 [Neolewinella aurantiaca]|uniref:Uncharacterized protein n=1 Tax=Neolewinella aurantiaca TaxID=2602767 RepID=A0A5C7FGN0_9BACT|nr:hypothetical protein [Neolewinella aurantiaca]TXF88875.1 hypothetical protein FUA23_12480 [Neolewinella aurantiaca]
MKFFPLTKLFMLLLACSVFGLSSCDDDDEVLGIDLTDNGTLFMSSNTSGLVGIVDTKDDPLVLETFSAAGTDSDGIIYADGPERLFQVNRSSNVLVSYEDVLDDDFDGEVEFTSSSDFTNGRGLVVADDNQIIVAEDVDDGNALVLYNFNDDTGFTKVKTVNTDFNLWGIEFYDGVLYAIVDNSDSIAVMNNFFDNADGATAVVDRYIRIDGLVRTHGIEYDDDDDLMILTDVGDGGVDNDGAIFIIRDFSDFTGDVVTSADYTKISGENTMLGNPVDIDYDNDEEIFYVAERLRNGGMMLSFAQDANGNVAPLNTISFPGISSLFLNED